MEVESVGGGRERGTEQILLIIFSTFLFLFLIKNNTLKINYLKQNQNNKSPLCFFYPSIVTNNHRLDQISCQTNNHTGKLILKSQPRKHNHHSNKNPKEKDTEQSFLQIVIILPRKTHCKHLPRKHQWIYPFPFLQIGNDS